MLMVYFLYAYLHSSFSFRSYKNILSMFKLYEKQCHFIFILNTLIILQWDAKIFSFTVNIDIYSSQTKNKNPSFLPKPRLRSHVLVSS